MKRRGLLQNAVILTGTSFILRTLGMIVRSFLASKMGEEGMGLYQLIISIYVLATTMVTAGISTAVTRMITETQARMEDKALAKTIMKKSLLISFIVSGITMLIFFYLAEPIGIWGLHERRVILSIRILLMVLPVVSISACFKSYFIALRKVAVNSISQLLEQAVRIGLIFFLFTCFASQEIEKLCILVVISDIISETIACLYLYVKYHREAKTITSTKKKDFSLAYFWQIAFPVTVNKVMASFLRTVENILIPSKLAIFTVSSSMALSQFGTLKAMALPLLFFPASFLTAISTLMVPETSEAKELHEENRIRRLVQKTFSMTLFSGILIAFIFYTYSNELGSIFYPQSEVAFYLHFLAPLVPFMYLESAIYRDNARSESTKKSVII